MGATGLYHIRRKPNSSASSLGRSSLTLLSAAFSLVAVAAAAARNRRRFMDASFYNAREPGVQFSFGTGLGGLTQPVVQTRQAVMRHRIVGAQLDAAPHLPCRVLELFLLVQQHSQLKVRFPKLTVASDGFSQQRLRLVRMLDHEGLGVEKAAHVIFRSVPGKGRKDRSDLRQAIFRLIQHASQKNVGLLDARIESNGSEKSVDGLRETPQAIIGNARGQFKLRALVKVLAAGIESPERCGEILTFQIQRSEEHTSELQSH